MIKLDGQRFGKLVVEQSFSKNHRGYSICRCDCGNRFVTRNDGLKQSNKRNNHTAQIDGVSRTLTEWAKIYGVRPSVVNWRVNNGWDIKQALETPVKHAKR